MSRYIDADAVADIIRPMVGLWEDDEFYIPYRRVLEVIADTPSIDIVLCKDCKHWVYNFNGCARNPCTEPWYATDFCNYGEREGK